MPTLRKPRSFVCWPTAFCIALLSGAVALVLTGCNIVGPAMYLAKGLPEREAEYILPDRPTLVYVDDRSSTIPFQRIRRDIAITASEELMRQEVLTTTISPRDAIAITRRESADEPMAIDEIGRAVGAEQVIYIEMQAFTITADGITARPTAVCTVKVIDAINRERMWPPPGGELIARPMQITTGEQSPERVRSGTGRHELAEDLGEKVGIDVARLFFTHVPNDIGTNLEPR